MAEFDLAVIGAGSAGLSVTAVAAQLGVRVALIERGRMGGDCLNTGCVPSKALLAACPRRPGDPQCRPAGAARGGARDRLGCGARACPGRHRGDRTGGFRGALPGARRHRAARRGAVRRARRAGGGRAPDHRPPHRGRRRQPGRGAADPGPGPCAVPDQRDPVRPAAAAGASADPRRRADRAGDGGRLRRAWLPRHRGGSGDHRQPRGSGAGRRPAIRARLRVA